MTGHARFGGRHAGKGRFFDRRMAEAAIQPQTKDMVLVTERNRLCERSHFARCPRRPIDGVQDPAAPGNQKPEAEDACSRNRIGAPAENLRHKCRGPLATLMPALFRWNPVRVFRRWEISPFASRHFAKQVRGEMQFAVLAGALSKE